MRFIRKNGRVIPVRGKDSAPAKKPPQKVLVKEHAATMTGLKWGAATSFLATPLVGIPIGFYKYRQNSPYYGGKKK
jgi:hypothetical protein